VIASPSHPYRHHWAVKVRVSTANPAMREDSLVSRKMVKQIQKEGGKKKAKKSI